MVLNLLQGDYIDTTIGTGLGISTMAAAALGNTISDLAGIGSAWYVENIAVKIGIKAPELSPEQLEGMAARWSANVVRFRIHKRNYKYIESLSLGAVSIGQVLSLSNVYF